MSHRVLLGFDDLKSALLLASLLISLQKVVFLGLVRYLSRIIKDSAQLTTSEYVSGLLGSNRLICICFFTASPLEAAVTGACFTWLELAVDFRNISA